jgi:hypothetical protein
MDLMSQAAERKKAHNTAWNLSLIHQQISNPNENKKISCTAKGAP